MAHIEGSPAVGLQVGTNARRGHGLRAGARRFSRPRDILEGPFGYFALYDAGQARWDEVAGDVGRVFQIARMSHKPYPTGRATHSGIGAALRLMREHALRPGDIAGMKVYASSLIVRLVGQPARPGMDSATARLCMGYTVATAILHGQVGIQDFDRTHWPIRAGWSWPPASRCWTTAIPIPTPCARSAWNCICGTAAAWRWTCPSFRAARRCRWTKPRKTPSSAPAAPRPNLPCRRTGPRR